MGKREHKKTTAIGEIILNYSLVVQELNTLHNHIEQIGKDLVTLGTYLSNYDSMMLVSLDEDLFNLGIQAVQTVPVRALTNLYESLQTRDELMERKKQIEDSMRHEGLGQFILDSGEEENE